MERYYWDERIEYLKKTRPLYYNDDYLEFLIQRVWKIREPVNIVDFGCGYGFLGLKLLPVLPKGSQYTGLDVGTGLIKEAEALFANVSYPTQFRVLDVNELQTDAKFDIAVCHALLLHMPDPKSTLRRMMACVRSSGLVIAFEPFWLSTMSHTCIHEVTQSQMVKIGILQKLYELDAMRTGKDGNVGMKLPVYMSEIGLLNVDCRVSDKVNHLTPHGDPSSTTALYESLCEEGMSNIPRDEEAHMRNLVERGLTEDEAKELFMSEVLAGTTFREHWREFNTLTAPTMMIAYGSVPE